MADKEKKQKQYERLDPKNDFIFKPVMPKAVREWERLSQDPRTRAQYLSRLKWKMDYHSGLN